MFLNKKTICLTLQCFCVTVCNILYFYCDLLIKIKPSPLIMASNLFDKGFKAVLNILLSMLDKPDFSAKALIPSLKPLPF